MLDFLSRTVRTTVDVVTLPVSVVADALPIDVDKTETFTGAKARRIADYAAVVKTLAE